MRIREIALFIAITENDIFSRFPSRRAHLNCIVQMCHESVSKVKDSSGSGCAVYGVYWIRCDKRKKYFVKQNRKLTFWFLPQTIYTFWFHSYMYIVYCIHICTLHILYMVVFIHTKYVSSSYCHILYWEGERENITEFKTVSAMFDFFPVAMSFC